MEGVDEVLHTESYKANNISSHTKILMCSASSAHRAQIILDKFYSESSIVPFWVIAFGACHAKDFSLKRSCQIKMSSSISKIITLVTGTAEGEGMGTY